MSTSIDINQNLSFANRGLFTQTATSTPVVNTTTETTILNGGIGTLSIPPNGFQVGDTFHAVLSETQFLQKYLY